MNDFKARMLRWNAGSKTRLQEPSQYSQNKGNPLHTPNLRPNLPEN